MIRALILMMFIALPAAAQDPILRAEMEETQTIPGQPLSLRLTLLVPSYMPDPPIWPSFEAPNLLVRLAASGPTSERIERQSWSGISRRYLIAPMVPGQVELPAQDVIVTWADPETNEKRKTTISTAPLTVAGILPEGAEGLDPFIAANSLDLSQEIEGTAEGMKPGDSLARSITATIKGTSPMFLPALVPAHSIEGLRAYHDDPVFDEKSERGEVSGTRTERTTYVAEGGGAGEAPAISLQWYNLESHEIETAELPAVAVSVDGPPAEAAREPRDWRAILATAALALLGIGLLAFAVRKLWPRLRAWGLAQVAAWRASELQAWLALRSTIRARDHAGLHVALDTWLSRLPDQSAAHDPRLFAALTQIGAARYGAEAGYEIAGWRSLAAVLPRLRQSARRPAPVQALPPLNPGA